jgi:carboxypeptidase PM20D1
MTAGAATLPAKKRVLRGLRWLGAGLVVLLAVLVLKALLTPSRQVAAEPADSFPFDEARAAEHLGRAVTFQTISHQAQARDPAQDPARNDVSTFLGLHAALREMFPKAFSAMELSVIGGASLLFTWKGKDPSRTPILLMAHQDVVPVEPGTEGDWQKPPFSGAIDGGYIWGRGTMDFKMGVVGLLEAVEALTAQGHSPARTIYLAFGHDEEISGKGAAAIAMVLASRKVHLSYVLDEGMVVTQGMLAGIDRPVALIGVAEKGYVTVELLVDAQGGHSSMPPRPTPAGILSSAIVKLEDSPMPGRIEGPVRMLFDTVAPEMPFSKRVILSNLWLLSGIVKAGLAADPATDALLRTTTAPTMLEGSVKDNVLPKRTRAVVNFRILPGDTISGVLEHVKAVIADERVTVRILQGTASQEASPVSDMSGAGYRSIEKTVRQIFPDSVVAPSLMLGATDARHYQPLADGVYRFSPQRMGPEDRPRFHGTNERISVKNYAECVRFYAQLIKNSDAL